MSGEKTEAYRVKLPWSFALMDKLSNYFIYF